MDEVIRGLVLCWLIILRNTQCLSPGQTKFSHQLKLYRQIHMQMILQERHHIGTQWYVKMDAHCYLILHSSLRRHVYKLHWSGGPLVHSLHYRLSHRQRKLCRWVRIWTLYYHGWSCAQCNNGLFPFSTIDDECEFVEALYEFINGSNIDLTVLKENVFKPLLLNDKTTIFLFEYDPDINFYNEISSIYVDNSNYYFEDQVSEKFSKTDITKTFSILHGNMISLPAHHTEWQAFLDSIEEHFTLIGLTETWLSENNAELYSFAGYNCVFNYRDNRLGCGVS